MKSAHVRSASSTLARQTSAANFLPRRKSLTAMREAAAGCRGCPLYADATQVVFGAGRAAAPLMLVGEAPGAEEDSIGRPFVGPAGRVLEEALGAAGVDRRQVYLTNAVKHFKWTPRGKRRLHAKPGSREISACRPWLEMEIAIVKPRILVCLGATAAQSLLGRTFRVTQRRGEFIPSPWAPRVLSTFHPSVVLRAPDSQERLKMRQLLAKDLELAVRSI